MEDVVQRRMFLSGGRFSVEDTSQRTSSWKEQHTLANWTGQKGVDFSKSMLFWVGKSKKQKISSMESQNIAISKFGNLSITDLEVIDDFESLFAKEFSIVCIV